MDCGPPPRWDSCGWRCAPTRSKRIRRPELVGRVRRLVRVLVPDIVTLIYLVFDPESGTLRFANAGHPPPLLVEGNGQTSYLEGGLGPPLGATAHPRPDIDATAHLDAGSTLLLFTDGLVERRGSSILDGVDPLKTLAAGSGEDSKCCVTISWTRW